MPNKNAIKLKGDFPDWMRKLSAADLIAQQKAFSKTKFCATEGCIENNFQWCHTIPKSSQLNQIAENNKVSWLPMREKDRWTLKMFWEETPTASALVFRGFCNKCDNDIFGKIDTSLNLSKETILLLSYRSACYYNWRSEVDLNSWIIRRSSIHEMLENNPELPRLNENFEKSHQEGLRQFTEIRDDVRRVMISIRDALNNKDYESIESRIFDFNEELPIRYSLAGSFTTSLLNERITVSRVEHSQMPAMFLHILSEGKTTKLIFSWLSTIPSKYPLEWIRQINQFSESGNLQDVLLRFMFINNHGLVFKPSFQNTFGHEGTNYLTAPLSGQVYHGLKPERTRICKPPYFNDNWKVSDVTSNYLA